MPPRLLIATPLYPPEIGGPATYTVMLETELPQHDIAVSTISFAASRRYPKVLRHLHYGWRVWRQLRAHEIVLAQDVLSVGLPTVIAAWLRRRPVIVRVPGDYAWEQSVQRYGVTETIDDFQTKRYGWRVELLRRLQRFVVKRATMVITPSEYFNDLVTKWGVSQERVTTIYNGVSFDGMVSDIQKPVSPTMVTAGRLVSWKGIQLLIELLPELPQWQLVILGDGPLRGELEAAADAHAVSDRVRFMGSVPRAEVLGWCRAADVFVLNTTFESFSFQTVEAMQSGVPVVATTVGSLPELITSGKEGILLEPNDRAALIAAIVSTQSEPEVWQTRTKAAIAKSATFSIAATAAQVATLITHLTTTRS